MKRATEEKKPEGEPKKKQKASCLNCYNHHKKCDGKMPCQNCLNLGKNCRINKKRKPVGRPKKDPQDKKPKKSAPPPESKAVAPPESKKIVKAAPQKPPAPPRELLGMTEMNAKQKCHKCSTLQEVMSRFCHQCGEKMTQIDSEKVELLMEVDHLRLQNQQLLQALKQKESELNTCSEMWALLLITDNNKTMMAPMPAYIVESSPAFNQLLGYESLVGAYLPDLVPKQMHRELAREDVRVQIEYDERTASPKSLCSFPQVFMRHKNGNILKLEMSIQILFDEFTMDRVSEMVFITKVLSQDFQPQPNQLLASPINLVHVTRPEWQLPEQIKFFAGNSGRTSPMEDSSSGDNASPAQSGQELVSLEKEHIFDTSWTLNIPQDVSSDLLFSPLSQIDLSSTLFDGNAFIPF